METVLLSLPPYRKIPTPPISLKAFPVILLWDESLNPMPLPAFKKAFPLIVQLLMLTPNRVAERTLKLSEFAFGDDNVSLKVRPVRAGAPAGLVIVKVSVEA